MRKIFLHRGIRYNCKYLNNDCDKCFSHPNGLYAHKRLVHQGIRYNCEQCDNQYTSSHMYHKNRSHFNCDICEKTFRKTQDQTEKCIREMYTHNPIECDICFYFRSFGSASWCIIWQLGQRIQLQRRYKLLPHWSQIIRSGMFQ